MQIRFPRNEDGSYNPAGSHLNPEQTNTTFKYTQQARFCLGVSKVRNFETGEVEGRRSRVFSYTNNKIVSIAEYKIKVQQEITRVQRLPTAPNLIWVVNTRPSDSPLYSEDLVTMIPKVGKKTATKLATHGITKVGHLSNLSPTATENLRTDKVRCLSSITTAAKTCHPGRCPHAIIDYRGMANPYLAKYGEARWREEIDKSTMLSPFISIKNTRLLDPR